MADEADGSVVLAQLQVAFLWESVLRNGLNRAYCRVPARLKCHF